MASGSSVLEFMARNWALMSIVPTLIILLVVPGVVIRKYVNIALNLMDDLAPPVYPEARELAINRNEGVAVQFCAFDGHLLRGTILAGNPDRPRRGAIVFAHEFGSDRWSHARFTCPLREAGYDILAFDFRGHGESASEPEYKGRQFPSDREQSDMLGAIAFMEDYLEQQGHSREIGILGLSRGAGAALLASVGIDSVRAVAVDGAYSSDTVMEYLIRRWASIFVKLRFTYEAPPPSYWRFLRWWILVKAERRFGCLYPSVRKALRRLLAPVFFIHGERDSFIPLEQTQMLYGLASEPKYLWTVPGARHNQSVVRQPGEYARRIVAFFDRHLAGVEAAPGNVEGGQCDLTQPIASESDGGRRRTAARAAR